MNPQIFAGICILICFIALYFAWNIYQDTRRMEKKAKEDEDSMNLGA